MPDLREEPDTNGIMKLRFPEPFNIAELLIDRHLAEGRGDKVAIRTLDRDVTYAELIAAVNRFGNTLKTLGVVPGERLVMIVNDCAEFVYLFLARSKPACFPCR